ncbi:copper oxidase [Synechococcus sp. RSCCF101]|uniref:multicopper oxidase family protein n=1 Tax=Synechococcus sp. RSCCF101 TaxID=2511069 RepID=UPI001248A70F|nr:multicopper oxidase domain-containing protein [Synechococcus sp. RSCCF101]QEY32330.1 copper oxidase [Synechococcus sp. RSCCF101]
MSFNYVVGGLYPIREDGSPNIVLSGGLRFDPATRAVSGGTGLQDLETDLTITTRPVWVPGIAEFVEQWLGAGLSDKTSPQSLFSRLLSTMVGNPGKPLSDGTGKWTTQARQETINTLALIGYVGPGAGEGQNADAFWTSPGEVTDPLLADLRNIDNYRPDLLWGAFAGGDTVISDYDVDALLENLAALDENRATTLLWYPALLYTYGTDQSTSYPGPVLMLQPGENLVLNFSNDIAIPGLTLEQAQQATLVANNRPGNSASEGLAASTSTNFHGHGTHTTPGGFGDNVVSRYTVGQDWTTTLDLPIDHGQGSYWYHPHYHPSVNQQVYGGQSGFMQIGDPLSKVPGFENAPRNLAVLKTMDLSVEGSELQLDGYQSLGKLANDMTAVTVNGAFQPTSSGDQGGWQSLTLSNQSNQAFYNVQLSHTDPVSGERSALPLWIYGEDGHQYPQIRRAQGALGSLGSPVSDYSQKQDLVSLAPGKRVDVLVYLPEGRADLESIYSFNADGQTFSIANMGAYPDYSAAFGETGKSFGSLASFDVTADVPGLDAAAQADVIASTNSRIPVQEISPDTVPEDYDTSAVPSVNLFEEDASGDPLWDPVRGRSFSWAKNTLVGDPDEWDPATQQLLAAENPDYQRYRGLTLAGGGELENWLGYENPFLINDHVFPYAPLVVSQLGTMEEWTLINYSVNAPDKYIGHPFHIHINDYQTRNSDTELPDKRNLEDVTMVNSSGYAYFDFTTGEVLRKDPVQGDLITIDEAINPESQEAYSSLATWGANTQTIRMLFQDYLGTYVFHCHILPHEDAGMMQAITVIDNTDSSWILPADALPARRSGDGVWSTDVVLADGFLPRALSWDAAAAAVPLRGHTGDVSGDFVQEVLISSSGDGSVRIFDGAALLEGRSQQLGSLTPYGGTDLAPWAFMDDVTGDKTRDLLTAGFSAADGDSVQLQDLTLKGWTSPNNGADWDQIFQVDPFDFIGSTEGALAPAAGLRADQVSVTAGDFNLDNFNDVVVAYATTTGGARITVLDGAALSLSLQTGQFEGGYFPDQALLADAIIDHPSLAGADRLSLTAGFNLYGQIALENMLLTSQDGDTATTLTLQLEAGHFIATAEDLGSKEASSGHGDSGHGGGHSHGGAVSFPGDVHVADLQPGQLFPVHLVDLNSVEARVDGDGAADVSVTPVFGGAGANGGVLVEGSEGGARFVVAQGNGFNGNDRTSQDWLASADQLPTSLDGLPLVDEQDLLGIGQKNPSTLEGQFNLVNTALVAYGGLLPDPSRAAFWVGDGLQTRGLSDFELASALLESPGEQALVAAHFGGSLDSLSVESILQTTAETLWGRRATEEEIRFWEAQVADGLSRHRLPMAVLQSTDGEDAFRLAFLSNAAQWSNAQWAFSANISGSTGLGLTADPQRFTLISSQVLSNGAFSGMEEAQSAFDEQSEAWLALLNGTEISNSGFF